MKSRTSVLPILTLIVMLSGCASTPPGLGPLQLVDTVDVQRYLGRWYEIARFPHGFESSIVGATAEYSLRDDGKIQVVNSGFEKDLSGKYTEVRATAWVPDPKRPGALKVQFFGLFAADYLIFGLDQEDYTWALVGADSRNYLWFLSRTPSIDPGLFDLMKGIAVTQGYDLKNLYVVPQKER